MEHQMPQEDTSRAGAPVVEQGVGAKEQGLPGGPSTSSGHKKRWTKKHTIIWVIVLVVVWFAGVQIMAAERYAAVVNVVEGTDKVGVNPTAERLDFGDLSRDTGASRFVLLENTGKRPKRIWVVKSGSIAELMKSNKPNWFTLAPGEKLQLEFMVRIPVSAPIQKYTGRVVIFKWPKVF